MGSWARRRPLKDVPEEAPSAPALSEAPHLSPRGRVFAEDEENPRAQQYSGELSPKSSLRRLSKPESEEKSLHDLQYAAPFTVVYPPNAADFGAPPVPAQSLSAPPPLTPGAAPPPAEAALHRQRSAAGRQESRRCGFLWVIPLIVVACVTMFIITMYENDCPNQTPHVSCIATWLGRLSFQPWSENPLLGPAANTLLRMGGLQSSAIRHGGGWRLLSCMWLHGGVFHLLVNMLGLLVVGVRLEKDFGAVRLIVLYFLSGVGGSLMSALFLTNVISVGASGALFGLLGATLADLLTNWTIYTSKVASLLSLLILIAVNLAFGLTPQVDNFCHIGGLATGFLLGFVLFVKPQFSWLYRDYAAEPALPYMHVEPPKMRKHKTYQYVLQVVATIVFLALFTAAFIAVFTGVDANKECSWCHYMSCVKTPLWNCNSAGGKQVTCDVTTYTNGTGTVGCADGRQTWVPNFPTQTQAQLQSICVRECA
eukprot:TRINITY_DN12413_c0_g1_i1.p1 TRINITY_DN12413_c0_g1~~TRINITY_DN12413_c0_g1_i1.p1  ORF type:complete len:482 (+),score=69.42 TRINITY_DN12413_c0_g1_i1:279-1724(+)